METQVPRLILDLATVLGVAAGISLLFRRLKQPVVLGYMLAGLIVGPHVPIPLVANLEDVRTLAELGVVLLMFSVGLEFDLRTLLQKGPSAMVLGVLQLGCTTWIGFLAGRSFGWTYLESGFLAAALSISSTMIIAKLFEEHGARGHLRDRVLSVLVIQDLLAILMLAGLDASTAAGAFEASGMGWALARVGLLLAGLLGIGGLLVPRLLRWAADQGQDETLLVAAVGVCFVASVLAALADCSMALGAFLAGMLAGASGRTRRIEHLVLPLRNLFAAIFFVAMGMMIEPRSLLTQAGPILAFTAVVLLGDALGATLGGALAGLPLRLGLRTGLALAHTGEFSFVLVSLGVQSGLLRPEFFAVPVGVCLLTALLGPLLLRRGDALAAGLERRLPERINRYLSLYQSWAARLGRSSLGRGPAPLRRPLAFLALDAGLINLVIIGAALLRLHRPEFQTPRAAAGLLLAQLALLALLAWALFGRARQIAGRILAGTETGNGSGRPEDSAGRRLLLAALSLGLLLLVGAPSVALLQPFLPRGPMLSGFLAGLGTVVGLLWAHSQRVRPESALGSEWLLSRVREPWTGAADPPGSGTELISLHVGAQSPCLGRDLGDLALESSTGATLAGLVRSGQALTLHPGLRLQAGDILALCGKPGALESARHLLEG